MHGLGFTNIFFCFLCPLKGLAQHEEPDECQMKERGAEHHFLRGGVGSGNKKGKGKP